MNKRIAKLDETSNIVSLTIGILTLPTDVLVDTHVLIPGLIGEYWRIHDAIKAWEQAPYAKSLLIPGQNPFDPLRLTKDNLARQFNLRRIQGVIIEDPPESKNTLTQSIWITKQLQNLGTKRIKIHVAPFHTIRAYLTLLKTWQKNNLEPLLILPTPTIISPFEIIPGVNTDSWSLIPGEIGRIRTYQEKGDLATFQELHEYLKWLWNNLDYGLPD